MTDEAETETTEAAAPKGLAKLKAFKEQVAAEGDISLTLPDSGVVVTMPAWKSNATWMKAQAMSAGDQRRGNVIYILASCRFDGERLTIADYEDNISQVDHVAIINKLFESASDRAAAADGAASKN